MLDFKSRPRLADDDARVVCEERDFRVYCGREGTIKILEEDEGP